MNVRNNNIPQFIFLLGDCPYAFSWKISESNFLPFYDTANARFSDPMNKYRIPTKVQGGLRHGESFYFSRTGQDKEFYYTTIEGYDGLFDNCSTARFERYLGVNSDGFINGDHKKCSMVWPHGLEDLDFDSNGKLWSVTEYEADYDSYELKGPCGGKKPDKSMYRSKQSGRYMIGIDLDKYRLEYCE